MKIPWLPEYAPPQFLPDASQALTDPPGLVAAGGALSREWLLHAYRHGIFPWYSTGQPILWWSPDPRCVLLPPAFRRHRSLLKAVRNRGYRVRKNTAFAEVIDGCAAPRDGDGGTWITPEMRQAYLSLHQDGLADSFEVWHGPTLVGGLYGVRLGRVFFGESMYSAVRDASKIALLALCDFALLNDIALIDCQLPTAHLASLGATTLPRAEFLARLKALTAS